MKTYVELQTLHIVFEFMAICPMNQIGCLLGQKINHATNTVWFQTIIPNNIAYVIALVKIGQ